MPRDITPAPYYRGEHSATSIARPIGQGRPVAGGFDPIPEATVIACSERRKDGGPCAGRGVVDGKCVGHRRAARS